MSAATQKTPRFNVYSHLISRLFTPPYGGCPEGTILPVYLPYYQLRRPDEILSIAHTFRGHVVLMQPSDRQYNNIHGLCNGKTVTNCPRGGVGGLRIGANYDRKYTP